MRKHSNSGVLALVPEIPAHSSHILHCKLDRVSANQLTYTYVDEDLNASIQKLADFVIVVSHDVRCIGHAILVESLMPHVEIPQHQHIAVTKIIAGYRLQADA